MEAFPASSLCDGQLTTMGKVIVKAYALIAAIARGASSSPAGILIVKDPLPPCPFDLPFPLDFGLGVLGSGLSAAQSLAGLFDDAPL